MKVETSLKEVIAVVVYNFHNHRHDIIFSANPMLMSFADYKMDIEQIYVMSWV